MDSFYVSLLSLFVLAISFSLHFLFFSKHKPSSSSSAPLPPGRTGWPVIGESLEFISTGWKGHPEKFIFDRISKHSSSVFRTHLLGEKAAVLCGAHGNKFLFSSENTLVQVWWPSSVDKIFPSSPTISSSKEEGIKMRKMLVPVFLKPEALQRFVGAMDQVARNHFSDRWENKDSVLVFPLAKNYIFSVACRLILSIEDPVRVEKFAEPFQVLAAGLFTVPLNLPGTPFNRSIKASGFIRKELVEIIKQRRSDLVEGKDLLSDLLVMSDENGKFMGDLEMADKILSLLIAAHDTTSSTCTSVVKYLAELPEIYEGVYKEQMAIVESKKVEEALNWDDIQKMKYSWNVACEVLRLAPPLQGAFREAITDFVFNGFSIPKGWKLYWSANSTHRNPECFPEPLKFDPSRFEGSGPAPYTFVPFGGGPRMCPGKEFSRLEILVFMHHLVKRFRWEKIIPDEKTFYNPMPSPAEGLPVRLYPHSPN